MKRDKVIRASTRQPQLARARRFWCKTGRPRFLDITTSGRIVPVGHQMETRIITGDEIQLARRLLYQVLVVEQSLVIGHDDPARLRVENGALCDMYDAMATWFGVFKADELIACQRFCRRMGGQFEIEHYHALPGFLRDDDMAVEATRLAVKKEYRGSMALVALMRYEYAHLQEHGYGTLFTAARFPQPGNLFGRRFGATRYGEPFRYFRRFGATEAEVCLYYIDGEGRAAVTRRLDGYLRAKER